MSARTSLAVLSLTALGLAAFGCHRPQGALMSYTGGSYTYYSYETQPKTVQLVDTRDNEVIFTIDIPAGKQLTLDFVKGKGDDPVYSPDLMRWEIFDQGTTTGKLRNAMSVPRAASRRIDMTLRPNIEYVTGSPDRELRTDQLADRPDWWTPAGGALPDDPRGLRNYDY